MSTSRLCRLNPPGLHPVSAYHHVAEVQGGRTIYISGQIALAPDGSLVGEGDFMAQARQVFRNLEAALAAVDADFGDVAKLTLFFTDRTDLAAFRQVRGEFIHPEQLPAMSAVQVAGLVQDDLLLELEAVAVVAD